MLEFHQKINVALPQISVVLPVFNKATALRATLSSLWGQDGRGHTFELELVLLDDASTDDSVAVARCWAEENQACMTLRQREVNAGPSICLNEAVAMASGEWLLVFDADDIAPANLILSMFKALQETGVDYLYGRSRKTTMTAKEAYASKLPERLSPLVSNDPCRLTLRHHIVHPVVLLRRTQFIAAGGASPHIFIQDESLAFRLALHSKRAGLLDLPCRYVLQDASVTHLSSNQAQQHHDQYWAAREAWLSEEVPRLWRAAFAGKCLSASWKSIRRQFWGKLALPIYLFGKIFPRLTYVLFASTLNTYFRHLVGVRRMPKAAEDSFQ